MKSGIIYIVKEIGGLKMGRKKSTTSEIFDWIKSIVVAVLIALVIKSFVFNTIYVLGNSMNPTLQERDRLFSDRISLYISEPKRGDIVVIEAPDISEDEREKDYIKRIIGVAEDKVEIKEGIVYLNGEVLQEDYIEEGIETQTYSENEWVVPDGEIFVLGDNRREGQSKDSRFFGCVPVDSVKGITKIRYFPFNNKLGLID